ncbi:MAG: hypothetical protein M1812_003242 [Candelaria pacifica]|nr:MAG: hypothetical protein M1812_003242 [Candelaria pacifica]
MVQTIQRLSLLIVSVALLTSSTATHQESRRASLPGQKPLCDSKFGQPNAEACTQALSLMSSNTDSLLTFGFEEAMNDLCKEDCVIQVDSLSLHPQADRDFNGSLKYEAIDTVTTCVQGRDHYGGESTAGRANNLGVYVFAYDSRFANEDALAEAAIAACFGEGFDASDDESVGSCAGRLSFQDLLNQAATERPYCTAMSDCRGSCTSPRGCDCVPQRIPQSGILFGEVVGSLLERIGSCIGNAGSVLARGLDGDARTLEFL